MASTLTKLSLLLVLVVMAEASIYRTTITTAEYESQSRRCRGQFSVKPLLVCSTKEECCKVLRNVDENCRCEALRGAGRELIEKKRVEEELMRRVVETFLDECDLEPYYYGYDNYHNRYHRIYRTVKSTDKGAGQRQIDMAMNQRTGIAELENGLSCEKPEENSVLSHESIITTHISNVCYVYLHLLHSTISRCK
ncbi:putative transcription factor KAN4 [Cinnamomum micranthum f. kanehirae]|uniref:Putative transcription factor KAN4 n=1 Tax=Cinnamomum micranthum f. kanehirae TaxID=337451 RepID=A0A3S3PA44_9MAGN|nr:putative transcription factor KAN4 [Cinnamomum micranthum f. kanehirae]